jgi:hypothetical protein
MSTKLGEGEEREEMLLKLSRSTPELDLAHLIGAQINEREREEEERRACFSLFWFSLRMQPRIQVAESKKGRGRPLCHIIPSLVQPANGQKLALGLTTVTGANGGRTKLPGSCQRLLRPLPSFCSQRANQNGSLPQTRETERQAQPSATPTGSTCKHGPHAIKNSNSQ